MKNLKEIKKELEGKETTLLELDNNMEMLLETEESIYNYLSESLEQHSFAYITGFENEEVQVICVDFEIKDSDYEKKLEKDEDYKFDMLIKVNNIFEL